MTRRMLFTAAVTGLLAAPSLLQAAGQPWDQGYEVIDRLHASNYGLSINPASFQETSTSNADTQTSANSIEKPVLTLDGAGGFASKIHGFGAIQVGNAYLTPRGLLVQNAGVVTQPVGGIIFDLYDGTGAINNISFLLGGWSSLHSHHPGARLWNEFDIFSGVSVKFLNDFTFSATWMAWMFPDGPPPHTEYNVEFKLAYDDTAMLKDWALHPYVSVFWNYNGDSPVVAGTSHTAYIELGVTPSYTWKAINDYPITFTFPTYFTFGDSSFWGNGFGNTDRSNLGVFSTGVKASVPLTFIPKDYGSWNAFVGVTYIHDCNPSLNYVNEFITAGGESNEHFLGYAGVGFGF